MEYLKKSELKIGSLYMKADGGVYWYAGRHESNGMSIFYKVHNFIVYDSPVEGVFVPFANEQHQLIGSAITAIMLSPVVEPRLLYITANPRFCKAVPNVYKPNCCDVSLASKWLAKARGAIITAERLYKR